MNIKARIAARKILLVYFYEQYFFDMAGKKDTVLHDIEKIQKIVANSSDAQEINLPEVMRSAYYEDIDAEIAYIIEHCFEKLSPAEIDRSYIKNVAPHFLKYKDDVREKVNMHAVTFGYDEMDIMDRVLFILGYVEYHEVGTPREVVLNEMVELAKRYGDENSPKLINGIGHKLLLDDSNQL